MNTANNDWIESERISNRRIKCALLELKTGLERDYKDSEFQIRYASSKSDDPACYISISKKGPGRVLGIWRKRMRLAEVRCAPYLNSDYPIQIICHSEDIEKRLAPILDNVSQELGARGVHIWRRGYADK